MFSHFTRAFAFALKNYISAEHMRCRLIPGETWDLILHTWQIQSRLSWVGEVLLSSQVAKDIVVVRKTRDKIEIQGLPMQIQSLFFTYLNYFHVLAWLLWDGWEDETTEEWKECEKKVFLLLLRSFLFSSFKRYHFALSSDSNSIKIFYESVYGSRSSLECHCLCKINYIFIFM